MVEHNLKLALQWAGKVAVLVQGRLVLVSENPESFVKKPEELEKYFFKKVRRTRTSLTIHSENT